MMTARTSRTIVALAAVVALSAGACGGGADGTPPPPPEPVDTNCTPLGPLPARIWRLSGQQYANSTRDLLGAAVGPIVQTTGGTSLYAFFSDENQDVNEDLAFQMNVGMRQFLTDNAARLPALAACGAQGEDACARSFAERFGARAFRRPLDAEEVTALLAVYTEGRRQDFDTGISLMVQALLQAPSFVFRSELGGGAPGAPEGQTTLTAGEIATQLAYTFLDSTPDQPLLDAAADGSLATPAGAAAQVDRLLQLDAVKRNITRIVLDWFNVQQLYAKTKDAALLVALPPASQALIRDDLYASSRLFVDDVLWSGSGKVTELVTSRRLFVNRRMGMLYGLPFDNALPEAFNPVDDPQRAGFLTQPSVLWGASDAAETSIVRRGIFLHNDVVCADELPPPMGILDDPDVQAKLAMLPTELDKSVYRMTTGQCSACHSQIDPYGLVLEGFDAAGRFRTTAYGGTVDPTGDFSRAPPLTGTITGPAAFAEAIVASKQFVRCAAQKIASYTIGRMIRSSNSCEVSQLSRAAEQADGNLAGLFRAAVTSNLARNRVRGGQ